MSSADNEEDSSHLAWWHVLHAVSGVAGSVCACVGGPPGHAITGTSGGGGGRGVCL